MAPFYGWSSTASRLQPLRGGSLLFTILIYHIYIYISLNSLLQKQALFNKQILTYFSYFKQNIEYIKKTWKGIYYIYEYRKQ